MLLTRITHVSLQFSVFGETEGADNTIQQCHTPEAVQIVEYSLKSTLLGIVQVQHGLVSSVNLLRGGKFA